MRKLHYDIAVYHYVVRFVLVLVFTFIGRTAEAQPGSLDPAFAIGAGASHAVNVAGILPDGRIFLGGEFSAFSGAAKNFAVCLFPNGTPDAAYAINAANGGFEGPVRALAVQPDGKVLVGGLFNTVNGISSKNIVRLDTSGVVDNTFIVGSGASNEVTHIATNGSRSVLIGFFNAYNGQNVPTFVVLQSDGNIDTSFAMPSTAFVNVSASEVLPGGKVMLAGNFTSYQGLSAGRIIRLNADGSVDTSFQPGQGLNSLVYTLAVQSDGRILVGGAFSLAAGQPRTRIARLMPDGSLDTSFNPGSGANGGVRSISLQADGKILIGGDFSSYNGVSVNRIARLLPDGSLDPSFLNQGGTNGTVKSIAIQTDGRIILGGTFTNLMGSVAGRVGRLIGDTCSLAAQISVDTLAAGGMIQLSTATPAGASYAWIDCSNGNAPIPGASAAVFTPQLPGNYAVVVQQSYCSDTSACVQVNPVITGTSAASAGTTFRVFPNPATDRLMLAVSGEPSGYGLRLFQANGTCALRLDGLSGPLQELMLPELVPGLYFLEIQGKNGVYRQKLIIR